MSKKEATITYPAGKTLYLTAYHIETTQVFILPAKDNQDGTYTATMQDDAPLGGYICRAYLQKGNQPDTTCDEIITPPQTRIWDGVSFGVDGPYRKAMTFD